MSGPATQSCPEPSALPIIFVPGIMGSRLRNRRTGEMAWDPGTNLGTLWQGVTQGAAAKRNRLVGPPNAGFSPNYLEVAPGRVGESNLTQERIDRGWGGLMQDFYGAFMTWLQHTAESPAMGLVPRGCFNLHYEAFAHPYNWMDDNIESGRRLGDRVQQAIRETTAKWEPHGVRILKPIIVSHSMGGLVTRAYTEMHGGAGVVHGVIHGAMPTHGSPATYKRIMAGFEGTLSRQVLGANQAEVTATAANCPGPLSLLPNKVHQGVDGSRDWLRVTGHGGGLRWSKPQGDPYSEIYTRTSEWWRMIYAQYLNPAGPGVEATELARFRTALLKAKRLHDAIGPNGFHPNTRMIYSNDRDLPSYDHVEWRQTARQDVPPSGADFGNDRRGTMSWSHVYPPAGPYGMPVIDTMTRYEIQEADAPGDGTVHTGSALYVSGPMTEASGRGVEHDQTFNAGTIRRVVARWLFEMVQEQL